MKCHTCKHGHRVPSDFVPLFFCKHYHDLVQEKVCCMYYDKRIFCKGDNMNAIIGVFFVFILYIVMFFLIICGIMSAIIIPNHLGLTGWNWIFLFISLLGVFLGGAGGSLITIKNHKY